jgi:hypothetical protein
MFFGIHLREARVQPTGVFLKVDDGGLSLSQCSLITVKYETQIEKLVVYLGQFEVGLKNSNRFVALSKRNVSNSVKLLSQDICIKFNAINLPQVVLRTLQVQLELSAISPIWIMRRRKHSEHHLIKVKSLNKVSQKQMLGANSKTEYQMRKLINSKF